MIIKAILPHKRELTMKHKRLSLVIFLAMLLIFLMLYCSLEYNNKDPNINYILENFDKYNNTQISFVGDITEINETSQTITVEVQEPPFPRIEVKTNNIKDNLHKRDIIEIIGILDGRKHVTAEKIYISERWKNDLIYIRSIPAIPFVLFIFFIRWRFNRKTYRFERRSRDA